MLGCYFGKLHDYIGIVQQIGAKIVEFMVKASNLAQR